MLGKFFNKILHEEETDLDKKTEIDTLVSKNILTGKDNFIAFLIFLLALFVRLYFLFFISNPQNAGVGWYGDTYHHWQIAYLTLTQGLKHGFLRLWDLKGMEYFWGLLHPLVLAALISITGSTSIVVTRILSAVCGSFTVALIYLLVSHYWNRSAAWGAVILAAFNPVGIFNDASGMVEPLAAVFLLVGIYFWPRRPILTGIAWVFASMARAEAWLFVLGLTLAIIIFESKKFEQKMVFLATLLVGNVIYMKYLLDQTGNAIYPIWWGFFGNAWGKWQADVVITPIQQQAQIIFIAMFLIFLLISIWLLVKKPRGWLLFLLGSGNFFFLGGFVGLTEYIKSYQPYFWAVRIFILPYIILGVAISVYCLYYLPKMSIPKWFSKPLGWLIILAILIISQPSWLIIWHYYQPTIKVWNSEVVLAKQVAGFYQGGNILIYEDDPHFTYALVHFGKTKGEQIRSQMFDPFYYWPKDVFNYWGEYREKAINWLKDENIRLLVIAKQNLRYHQMIEEEPELFSFLGVNTDFNIEIYEVKL